MYHLRFAVDWNRRESSKMSRSAPVLSGHTKLNGPPRSTLEGLGVRCRCRRSFGRPGRPPPSSWLGTGCSSILTWASAKLETEHCQEGQGSSPDKRRLYVGLFEFFLSLLLQESEHDVARLLLCTPRQQAGAPAPHTQFKALVVLVWGWRASHPGEQYQVLHQQEFNR